MPLQVERKSGSPNIQKLAKPTKSHPKGRVKLDENGEIVGPKANVLGKRKVRSRDELGNAIVVEAPINGGHILYPDRVWRLALRGPTRYHARVLSDEERYRLTKKQDFIAPTLELTEAREYEKFLEFVKAEKVKVRPYEIQKLKEHEVEYDKIDTKFYKWLNKKDEPTSE